MQRCSATISFADEAGAPSRYCLGGRVARPRCRLAVDPVRLCRLDFRALALGPSVTLQLTILKVLNGQPDGRASLVDLKRYVEILITSGPDWTARMKRLAARAPALDIFGQSLVRRFDDYWQITDKGRAFLAIIDAPFPAAALTDAGRAFLASIEAPAPAAAVEPAMPAEAELSPNSPPVLVVGPKRRTRQDRRRRAGRPTRRSSA